VSPKDAKTSGGKEIKDLPERPLTAQQEKDVKGGAKKAKGPKFRGRGRR
jgi:hypothetical protein